MRLIDALGGAGIALERLGERRRGLLVLGLTEEVAAAVDIGFGPGLIDAPGGTLIALVCLGKL